MHTITRTALATFIAAVCLEGAVLEVSPDGSKAYTNIQDAIDAAPIGGWTEIVIYPGVYHENLLVRTNQSVYLHSTNENSMATRAATVVDGSGVDSVLRVYGDSAWNGTRTTCTVAGVTITNGSAITGGGIWGDNKYSTPYCFINLRHCTVAGCVSWTNHYSYGGGGIAYTRGTLISNLFINNHAANSGGAIYEVDGRVEGNHVCGNHADTFGGGLYKIDGAVVGNTISNNSAGMHGGGGYDMYTYFSQNRVIHNYARYDGGGMYNLRSAFVNHNEFRANVAGDDGGAIAKSSSGIQQSDFVNNLVCDNIASNRGGGMAYCGMDLFLNNTIAGNRALNNGGGLYDVENVTFINTIVAHNTMGGGVTNDLGALGPCEFYHCCVPTLGGLDGTSTSNDPKFVTPEAGNYHLRAASPCVNTGGDDFHYPLAYAADLDGLLRYEGIIDMGCYERGSQPDHDGDWLIDTTEPGLGADPTKWDTNGDGYPDGLHVARGQDVNEELTNRTFAVVPGGSVQAPMGLAVPGDSVRISTGHYHGVFLPQPDVNVIGTTNAYGEPLTVLDGQASHPCVLLNRGYYFEEWNIESDLAGLVLSNGMATVGGGIRNMRFDNELDIGHVVIVNNQASERGGGIGAPGGNGIGGLHHSHVRGNHASDEGGGAYQLDSSVDGIYECVFTGNTASNGGACSSCGAIMDRCVVTGNTAHVAGGGLYYCGNRVRNCLIAHNAAATGGGVADLYDYDCKLQNNTIVANNAQTAGGGIWHNSINRELINNIVWGNTAPSDAQVYWAPDNSTLYHNTIQDWADLTQGNRSNQPLFVSAGSSNYRLQPGDVVNIDSGTNLPETITTQTDLDGGFRVIGAGVDRGCYEEGEEGFDFAAATQRFAVVFGTGDTKFMRRYVVAPVEDTDRRTMTIMHGYGVQPGRVQHPAPNCYCMDYALKRLCTGGDSYTYGLYDPMGMSSDPQKYPPQGGYWMSMYGDIGKEYYYLTDVFPRDGYPGAYGGVIHDTYYGKPPKIKMWPNTFSAVLPAAMSAAAVATPGDYLVGGAWDDEGDYGFGSWGDPADPLYGGVFTDTLSAWDTGYMGVAPVHVDLNGDGNYDRGTIARLSDTYTMTAPAVVIVDAISGTEVMSMTVPAAGYETYQLGSFPGGITVAGIGADEFYTYLFEPTQPQDGVWRTTICQRTITRLGYTTSREIIPEPVFALGIYLVCGAGLWLMVRR